MFRVSESAEKGKKNAILPMAAEFSAMADRVPSEQRTGWGFAPTAQRGGRVIRRVDTVSSIIGEKAGVKVSEKAKQKTKYASAHDLRRSFGYRWAMRVMPPVLMQLMRHESIQTTQEFYVGRNAEAAADVVWEAFDNLDRDKNQNSRRKTGGRASKSQSRHE